MDPLRRLPERPGRSRELDREIRLPVAGIYVRWDFGAPVATLEWDLKVLADPDKLGRDIPCPGPGRHRRLDVLPRPADRHLGPGARSGCRQGAHLLDLVDL